MKNDTVTPSVASTEQANGDDSEVAEVETDTAKSEEPEEPVFVKGEGEFTQFLREFGIHGTGYRIAKFFFILFGLLIGISGLVIFGVLINTFLMT
jgi:hypothetical protein